VVLIADPLPQVPMLRSAFKVVEAAVPLLLSSPTCHGHLHPALEAADRLLKPHALRPFPRLCQPRAMLQQSMPTTTHFALRKICA